MRVGDRVRIRPGGASVITIVKISEDDGRFLIEPVDETAPGRHPFPMKPGDLIPEAKELPPDGCQFQKSSAQVSGVLFTTYSSSLARASRSERARVRLL